MGAPSMTPGALALGCLLVPWVALAQVGAAPPASAMPPHSAGLGVEPEPPAANRLTYALGLAVIDSPTYAGADGREQKLRLLWSVRHGRFRISGARSSGLMGASTEKGSGASADLIDGDRFRLALGLRYDNGRSPGDDPALAGLPEIRSTLRGRLQARLDLGGGFGTSLSYSADLLGREGGGQLGWGLGYGWAPWPGSTATAGVGATWADARHMNTYFGIAPDVAARTGRAAYVPGAGLLDLSAGLGLRVPLGPRWVVISGLALTRLQGDAAASPLTRQAQGVTASVALAWLSK